MPIEPDDLDFPPHPASPAYSPPPPLRSQLEVVRTGSNARWGAVLAGVFVTLSTWAVLHVFGMGVGMTALSPDDDNHMRALGLGVGIWSTLAPIIALFAGGLVASRLAPTPNRVNRMLHGLLVWSLTTLLGAVGIVMIVSSLARGAVQLGAAVGDAVGGAAGQLDNTARALGLDAGDLVAPINERLRAEGKPTVTAGQLERALDDAISTSVREGKLDRDAAIAALDKNTKLDKGDIEDLTNELEARWQRAAQRAETLASRARTASLQAADATGKVLLGTSIALILGLIAAIGGALATGNHDRRRTIG
ncbi:MAG TPA: hypothetical protein VM261_16620 [Kofleriaceae bacterium]|nr:hypothetical protein [Kofleriaceae bacterium]